MEGMALSNNNSQHSIKTSFPADILETLVWLLDVAELLLLHGEEVFLCEYRVGFCYDDGLSQPLSNEQRTGSHGRRNGAASQRIF